MLKQFEIEVIHKSLTLQSNEKSLRVGKNKDYDEYVCAFLSTEGADCYMEAGIEITTKCMKNKIIN